jgi:hypothetical protein
MTFLKFRSFLQQVPEEAAKVREDVERLVKERKRRTQDRYPQMRAFYEENLRNERAGAQ